MRHHHILPLLLLAAFLPYSQGEEGQPATNAPRPVVEIGEEEVAEQPKLPALWNQMTRSGTKEQEIAKHAQHVDPLAAVFEAGDTSDLTIEPFKEPKFFDGLTVINNGTNFAVVPEGTVIHVPPGMEHFVGTKIGRLVPLEEVMTSDKIAFLPLKELSNGDIVLPAASEVTAAKGRGVILITGLDDHATAPYTAPASDE